jgi:hypothetical protein
MPGTVTVWALAPRWPLPTLMRMTLKGRSGIRDHQEVAGHARGVAG